MVSNWIFHSLIQDNRPEHTARSSTKAKRILHSKNLIKQIVSFFAFGHVMNANNTNTTISSKKTHSYSQYQTQTLWKTSKNRPIRIHYKCMPMQKKRRVEENEGDRERSPRRVPKVIMVALRQYQLNRSCICIQVEVSLLTHSYFVCIFPLVVLFHFVSHSHFIHQRQFFFCLCHGC